MRSVFVLADVVPIESIVVRRVLVVLKVRRWHDRPHGRPPFVKTLAKGRGTRGPPRSQVASLAEAFLGAVKLDVMVLIPPNQLPVAIEGRAGRIAASIVAGATERAGRRRSE